MALLLLIPLTSACAALVTAAPAASAQSQDGAGAAVDDGAELLTSSAPTPRRGARRSMPGPSATPVPAPTSSAPAPAATPAPAASTAVPTPSAPPVQVQADSRPFTAASFWRTSVRSAPVAPDSATQVADLDGQVDGLYGGTAAFNNHQYGVGFHVATAQTPRVDVQFFDCQGKGWVPTGVYDGRAQWLQVPIPADAVVAPGSDKNLTVWSPSTDQLWEFWVAERSGAGWRACWGGRIDEVSTSPGYFEGGFGAAATGLSLAGGMVGLDEVRGGRIDHAMALNVFAASSWQRFSWPAQRSDGHDPEGDNPIAEGTRLRLDPSVDVARLGLHPIAAMIATAAQEYGFVVTDTGGAVAVVAEAGALEHARTGVDPWHGLQAGTPDYRVLAGFPWDRLQALAADYGRPSS